MSSAANPVLGHGAGGGGTCRAGSLGGSTEDAGGGCNGNEEGRERMCAGIETGARTVPESPDWRDRNGMARNRRARTSASFADRSSRLRTRARSDQRDRRERAKSRGAPAIACTVSKARRRAGVRIANSRTGARDNSHRAPETARLACEKQPCKRGASSPSRASRCVLCLTRAPKALENRGNSVHGGRSLDAACTR